MPSIITGILTVYLGMKHNGRSSHPLCRVSANDPGMQ